MKKEFDPRMHSAEHILNQTMVRRFGCKRCFSAHIEKKKSKCDYHLERPLSEEEIRGIEKGVNDVIRANVSVREEYLTNEEASDRYNLDRLPDDGADPIRIVKIGEFDACPCIGAHVNSTGEIGGFKILSSSFEKGVLRIRYKLTG